MTPEEDIDGELNVEHNWSDGRARLTLFRDRTNDAIISQTNLATNPVTGTQVLTTTIGNVDATRGRAATAFRRLPHRLGPHLGGGPTH
jgi:iron complex outermembrane recepter protein